MNENKIDNECNGNMIATDICNFICKFNLDLITITLVRYVK